MAPKTENPDLWGIIVSNLPVGVPSLLVLVLIYAFVIRPESGERWIAWISLAFAKFSHAADRRYVAGDISVCINSFRKRLNREVQGLIPFPVRVKWLKGCDFDEGAFTNDDEVILLLRHHPDQDRNLAFALMRFLRKGLLVYSRQYVEPTLLRSVDIAVARSVLAEENRPGALDTLHSEFSVPATEESPVIEEYSSKLERIRLRGFMNVVFLRELMEVGRRLFPASPSSAVRDETVRFLDFLDNIATKDADREVELAFSRGEIRTYVLLVARSETVQERGIGPHVNRAIRVLSGESNRLYLCGMGAENCKRIREIMGILGTRLDVSQDSHQFRTRNDGTPGMVVSVTRDRATLAFVQEKMAAIVPNVADGSVEVVGAAREFGKCTKIAVTCASGREDVIGVCLGPDGEYIRRLEEALGEEVDLIRWSPDPRDFIRDALRPARVEYVEADDVRQEASAFVVRDQAGHAVGANGVNVRLASRLTGWKISIERLDVGGDAPVQADVRRGRMP